MQFSSGPGRDSEPLPRPDLSPERSATPALSVSQITRQIRGLLESRFERVRVQGEVVGLSRPRSGHVYFNLKDDGEGEIAGDARISAVLWRTQASRLRFPLEDGIRIIATGRITVYEPRGSYQLVVDRIEPAGRGTLLEALERLKQKLLAEGLFDPDRKLPLPPMPRTIGLITSPSGAAVQDVLRSLGRKFPVRVKIYPARVQGEGSAREVVRALDQARRDPEPVDVLILARGGGSLEDLWTFNEEAVVRAVASCPLPTVSGVGHEVDVTLVDLVASVRAQTPTHAGELVVPDFQAVVSELLASRDRLFREAGRQLERRNRELVEFGRRLKRSRPDLALERRAEHLARLAARIVRAMRERLARHEERLKSRGEKLEALDPHRILRRGYAAARGPGGAFIRSARELRPGQEIRLLLAEGSARVEVIEVETDVRSPIPELSAGDAPDLRHGRDHGSEEESREP